MEEREWREREQAEKQQREEKEREEARRVETPQSQKEEAVAIKRPKTERSESEMDTEGGGEARTSTECQSRYRKGHITNIYLIDSDEWTIVHFGKDHEELCNKINKHFKDKARKYCL